MSFSLSVISHPTSDISKPALFLEDKSTGDRTIIGNVPAGLQRQCNEKKYRISRLKNIFLTGVLSWKAISGLPGFILTVSDQGVKKLGIYHSGNKLIQYMVSCWRYFVFRFGMNLNIEDVNQSLERDSVKYIPINIHSNINYGSNENDHNLVDHAKLNQMVSNIFPIQANPSNPTNSKKITNVTLPKSIINPKVSTNWIIYPKPTRGKFLVNNAKSLGCDFTHFKKLCNNEEVVLENGTIVKPEQVLEPTRYFAPILVLDIPSEEYMENFINHDWKKDCPDNLSYGMVFHFFGESIQDPLSNEKYIRFIKSFGPSTMHLISHKSYCPNSLNFHKTFRVSLKWKSLIPNFFPLPKWTNKSTLKINNEDLTNVIPLISGQQFLLTPSNLTQNNNIASGENIPLFEKKDCNDIYDMEIKPLELKDVASREQFNTMIDESNNNNVQVLKTSVDLNKSLKDQVDTLVLGTGSALPSTVRNVLSNIVRIPYVKDDGTSGYRSILLDGGENSFGTLRRIYKQEEVEMLLDELKMVYLSHLHADHHLGIVDFIREWNSRQEFKFGVNERFEKLIVIAPWQYEYFLQELNRVDPFINTDFIVYISCEEFMLGKTFPTSKQFEIEEIDNLDSIPSEEVEFVKDINKSEFVYSTLGMDEIKTCAAQHCDFSYSVSMSFKLNIDSNDNSSDNIFKISYSGDTRPKFVFTHIGENSDLLIHESTLEDEKFKDAFDKRHSTTSEAVHVGILMKAKKILLTHFSQRYKSFTCSDVVYKRLENPITKDDLIDGDDNSDSPLLSTTTFKEYYAEITNNPELAIEIKSPIFSKELDIETRAAAGSIEILFAFDNMKIQYDEFHIQRKVFESQGANLEKLFGTEEEEEEIKEDVEDKSSKKETKSKKKKSNSGNGNKKQKV